MRQRERESNTPSDGRLSVRTKPCILFRACRAHERRALAMLFPSTSLLVADAEESVVRSHSKAAHTQHIKIYIHTIVRTRSP